MKDIKLSNGMVAIIDEQDQALVTAHNWFSCSGRHTTYAVTSVRVNDKLGGINIRMHRLILGLVMADRRVVVDHRDGNGLNNTRYNLRICTISENLHGIMRGPRGKSKYRGVSWSKAANKWEARISIRGKRIGLGFFDSEMQAARAYDAAKHRLIGADYESSGI